VGNISGGAGIKPLTTTGEDVSSEKDCRFESWRSGLKDDLPPRSDKCKTSEETVDGRSGLKTSVTVGTEAHELEITPTDETEPGLRPGEYAETEHFLLRTDGRDESGLMPGEHVETEHILLRTDGRDESGLMPGE
jgi:hypothetical protein